VAIVPEPFALLAVMLYDPVLLFSDVQAALIARRTTSFTSQ
jgi:hypothetical protein